MDKSGFKTAMVGTVSYLFEVDANGNLVTAEGGAVSRGTKRIAINNIDASATKNRMAAVAAAFFRILPGTDNRTEYDDLQTTFTVKWEVE